MNIVSGTRYTNEGPAMNAIVHLSPDASDAEVEQVAFETFATLYPHECYAAHPTRFLEYARRRCPHLSEAEIVQLLNATEDRS